jgi:hypothetical protein
VWGAGWGGDLGLDGVEEENDGEEGEEMHFVVVLSV